MTNAGFVAVNSLYLTTTQRYQYNLVDLVYKAVNCGDKLIKCSNFTTLLNGNFIMVFSSDKTRMMGYQEV